MQALAVQLPMVRIKEAAREIHFPGGGWVEVRTADDPHALRAGGWDFVVMDECRDIHQDAWTQVIRPAIMDRRGHAMFLSTPRGLDWFYKIFEASQRLPDWERWQLPSHNNPFIPRDELERLEPGKPDGLPELVYRQEILAEFIPDGGEVFRDIYKSSSASPVLRCDGVVGFYDPARTIDYDAIAIFRNENSRVRQLYADRWNAASWEISLGRLAKLRGFSGDLYVDSSVKTDWSDLGFLKSIQEAVGPGLHVSPFQFSQRNKQSMTEHFAQMLETERVALLKPSLCEEVMKTAVEAQIIELRAWRPHKLPSGLIRYAGPDGIHDDMAIACLTAAHLATEGDGGGSRFSGPTLRQISSRLQETADLQEDLDAGERFRPWEDRLKCWRRPVADHKYVIGAHANDVHAAAAVLDITTIPSEQVAEWAGNIDQLVFGRDILSPLGSAYNHALVAPERSGRGHAVIAGLAAAKYPRVYRHKIRGAARGVRCLGWPTDEMTRPIMFSELKTALDGGLLHVRSAEFIQAAMRFQYEDTQRAETDSLVFAWAIAWQVRRRALAPPLVVV